MTQDFNQQSAPTTLTPTLPIDVALPTAAPKMPIAATAPKGDLHPIDSYYAILGVSQSATRLEIREAYLRLRITYGQGSEATYSLISEEEAKASLHMVEQAYITLNDDLKRERYDGLLRGDTPSQNVNSSRPQRNSFATADAHVFAAESRPVRILGRHDSGLLRSFSGAETDGVQSIIVRLRDSAALFGKDLKELREAAGVSEAAMQDRCKIGIEQIRAMETENKPRLLPAVYIRGFLKSYLRYLGIADSELLIKSYVDRVFPAVVEP